MAKSTPQSNPPHLGGLNVLITRPAAQAQAFAEAVQQAHGRPVSFPALEILGPANKKAAQTALNRLDQVNLVIFTSANAVQYAFPLLPEYIPLDLPIAAIGSATAAALKQAGLAPTLVPQQPDSEGLLALPELQQITGQHILIVRGNGGRATLRDTLSTRGATVRYAEVYRRQCPQRNPNNLIQHWGTLVDVVTVTSNAILDNLHQMLGSTGQTLLHQTPVLVPGARVASHARKLGCQRVYQAASALDCDMLIALTRIQPSDSP
ncbi:MAG: uroporphyrinogen-III synthase [Pseudomonadota bacterium]